MLLSAPQSDHLLPFLRIQLRELGTVMGLTDDQAVSNVKQATGMVPTLVIMQNAELPHKHLLHSPLLQRLVFVETLLRQQL